MMKRFTTLLAAVVFGGLVLQTGLVSAKGGGNNGNNGNNSNRNRSGNSSNQSQSSQQSMKVAKVNKSVMKLNQQGIGNDKSVQGNRVGIQDGLGTRRPNLVQKNLEGWKQMGDSFGIGHGKPKHDKKKDQAVLGPGRPDGRVEVPASPSQATLLLQTAGTAQLHTKPVTTTTVPARNGYVWNNGHWERAKANGTSVSTQGRPLNTAVEIRDHRTVVTPPPAKSSGRGSYAPYGRYGVTPPPVDNAGNTVTVTVTPGSQRDRTIYGTGPGLYEFLKIHDPRLVWEYRPGAGFTKALHPSRDHRTPSKDQK